MPPSGGASALRAWVVAALDLVFPAWCPVCRAPLGPGRRDPLCAGCWSAIVRLPIPACEICGIPLGAREAGVAPLDGGRCGSCATMPRAFDYARAAALYAGPLREALHTYKFSCRRALARPLADLMVEQMRDSIAAADVLVPVPLAPRRERERGFNQAALVAEHAAARTGVAVRAGWLQRVRTTPPQSELTAAERRTNVAGAFRASPRVAGLHVAVVDDILTTGATAEECAGELRRAGAARIGVLTVARVP